MAAQHPRSLCLVLDALEPPSAFPHTWTMFKTSHLPILAHTIPPALKALWASLVAQMVKYLPAMQETQVQPLDQKDPLEKEMATHFSILAWRIP